MFFVKAYSLAMRKADQSPAQWSLPGSVLKAGPPPLEAILVIIGRRALIFFVWKLLEKNEKWRHFCAHAQWWSPWRRKNAEKGTSLRRI